MPPQRLQHYVAALLIPVALVAFAPSGASAHPTFVAPGSMRPTIASSSQLSREVFGFALASSLADPSVGYPSWDFSLLSTVAFFSLHVDTSGAIAQDSAWSTWNSSALTGLLSTAHASHTRVVVTIDMQDFAAGNASMCSALINRAITVAQTVAQVSAKGVDGVNVDYEGLNGTCSNGQTNRSMLVALVQQLRSALPSSSYLSIDTYASSAADPIGFFDVSGLNQYVDAFFVMAYDLEYSNWHYSPPGCTTFCLGPTSPLAGYYYNSTATASQYLASVPASKVILGVPYYGRKACVARPGPNAYPIGGVAADTYLDASGETTAAGVQSYVQHRDANDPTGQERWDTWYNTSLQCTRELYWDDTVSLGQKYDLVNEDALRGVGLWTLNYGGGAPELWQLLATKFRAAWSSLGGVATSGADMASWGSGRVDLFARGQDNGLWHVGYADGRWYSWERLGGVISSAPAAVSWGYNRIDVFALGQDKALWHLFWNGATWSTWERLGGVLVSGPDVASWGPGRLDVFALGQDRAVWHIAYSGGRWYGWQRLGGVLTSDPSAVSWGSNRIDLFARGQDNALWHMSWSSSGWSAWQSLGGIITSGPDASSCAPGQLNVFALGGSATLYRRGFNGTWDAWQGLGTDTWTSDPTTVCERGTGMTQIGERGSDNAIWYSTIFAS